MSASMLPFVRRSERGFSRTIASQEWVVENRPSATGPSAVVSAWLNVGRLSRKLCDRSKDGFVRYSRSPLNGASRPPSNVAPFEELR